MASVLSSHSPTLHSIAFLLPNDIEKLLEDQALEINMAILANKKHSSMLSESLIKGKHDLNGVFVLIIIAYFH